MPALSNVKVYLDDSGRAVAAELDGKRIAGLKDAAVTGKGEGGLHQVALVLEGCEVLALPAKVLEFEQPAALPDEEKTPAGPREAKGKKGG
jgi:hypothetical protein